MPGGAVRIRRCPAALYVVGYSGCRIFEETIWVDSFAHFLGLRLM